MSAAIHVAPTVPSIPREIWGLYIIDCYAVNDPISLASLRRVSHSFLGLDSPWIFSQGCGRTLNSPTPVYDNHLYQVLYGSWHKVRWLLRVCIWIRNERYVREYMLWSHCARYARNGHETVAWPLVGHQVSIQDVHVRTLWLAIIGTFLYFYNVLFRPFGQ